MGEDLAFLTNVVAPEYLRTLTIGLVAGREFESRDDPAAPPVAIVNETLARRFWSDPSAAIGQRLRVGTDGWRTVIGVARDIKYSRVTERPRPYVYLPLLQTYQSSMVLHVRGISRHGHDHRPRSGAPPGPRSRPAAARSQNARRAGPGDASCFSR